MKRLFTVLITIIVVIILLHSGFQKIYYASVGRETLTGTVRCVKSADKNYDFYLFYVPAPNGKQSDFKFVKLKGREWLFEGEIIKWRRPLNFLGFRTAQRPVRIYDSEGNSCFIKTKPGEVVFKVAKFLPGIDTSFISIVRQPFKPKVKFGIYATNTGYLVRKIR